MRLFYKTRIEKQKIEVALLVKEKVKKDSLAVIKKNKLIRKRFADSVRKQNLSLKKQVEKVNRSLPIDIVTPSGLSKPTKK